MQYIDLETQRSPCTHGLRASTSSDDECNATAMVKVLLQVHTIVQWLLDIV